MVDAKLKIALIRFSSIGDIVLTNQFLNSLDQDKVEVIYFSFKNFESILVHPIISHKFLYEKKTYTKDLIKDKEKIKDFKLDLIVDLHGNARSLIFKLIFFKIPSINFDKRRIERSFYLKFNIDLFNNKNKIAQRYYDEFCLYFKKYFQDKKISTKFLKFDSKKTQSIVISSAASFQTKRWPIKSLIKLMELILAEKFLDGFSIILVGGEDCIDSDLESFSNQNKVRIINKIGKFNLIQTMQSLAEAKIAICNDSSVLHLSESVDTPVIALFGPTQKIFGFAPLLPSSEIVSSNLNCSPCSLTGSKPCQFQNHLCMETITPSIIFNLLKIKLLLKEEN